MQDKTVPPAIPPEVSLIRGGPFYRFEEATKLIGPNQWNLGRRIVIAITIGWVAPLLIAAITKPNTALFLLKNYSIASRMLIAVPVLLLAQAIMEARFRTILSHIFNAKLLDADALARMENILAKLVRLRDSIGARADHPPAHHRPLRDRLPRADGRRSVPRL